MITTSGIYPCSDKVSTWQSINVNVYGFEIYSCMNWTDTSSMITSGTTNDYIFFSPEYDNIYTDNKCDMPGYFQNNYMFIEKVINQALDG